MDLRKKRLGKLQTSGVPLTPLRRPGRGRTRPPIPPRSSPRAHPPALDESVSPAPGFSRLPESTGHVAAWQPARLMMIEDPI